MQFIGAGMGKTVIETGGGRALSADNLGSPSLLNNIQIYGMDIDCGLTGGVWHGQGSNMLFDSLHAYNYSSTIRGKEDSIIYTLATSGPGSVANNISVTRCRFTPASTGNVDGTSVVALSAAQYDGSTYLNNSISDCIFDTPTDPGTLYYFPTGGANSVTGCSYTSPSFAFGAFYYLEPGSINGESAFQDDSSSTYVLSGNVVKLTPNYEFVDVGDHVNGRVGNFVITGNTITNGPAFQLDKLDSSCAPVPIVKSVTVQHNVLNNARPVVINGNPPGGAIPILVTSPNP